MSPRFVLFSAATAALLAPLLYDAVLKGVLLLAAAGLVVLVLRRASAATRHLVWLVAVVALLTVPVLTVMLPRWRVLPAWAAWPSRPVEAPKAQFPGAGFAGEAASAPAIPVMAPAERASSAVAEPVAPMPKNPGPPPLPSILPPVDAPPLTASAQTWVAVAWAAGFLILSIRLLAAHCLLRCARRRSEPCPSGPLADALAEAAEQLGLRQRVSLRLDSRRSIPLVWGVWRPCLLLPAEAREWGRDQLRSVLLHELAHVKRRDPLVQAIAQVALALHWINPLAWLASWRLHVERERACDDLVLASGVRGSDYAAHLLRVATQLPPAPGTSACGLAMARRSSLEGRLRAVLNDTCDRRGISRALTAAALLLSLAIAIPVAMLRAADATGNPRSQERSDIVPPDQGARTAATPAPSRSQATTLDPAIEAQLDWGEAVNGLRGAIIIRSPDAGQAEGIFLAVQNVSDAPLRFVDATKSERLRTMRLSLSGRAVAGLTNGEPTMTDVVLVPREAVFLPLMLGGSDEVTASLVEGLRKDSLQTWNAVLDMAQVPEGAWKGRLTTGETRGTVRAHGPQPKSPAGQALFKVWQNSLRLNGDIPGGLVRLLHEKVSEFIRNNEPDESGGPSAQKMKPLEPRFAHTGDWKAADVVALLDDIAAAHPIPLEMALMHLTLRTASPGVPLPASLETADWGEPLPSGLRVAHVLEPRAEAYRLGTKLKARILLHNTGKEPVTFITDTFQQPVHDAMRADGSALKVDSTSWTTGGREMAYRLAPGNYCEVLTPGLGIGAPAENRNDWETVRAGSWILCTEGDDVVFTPGATSLSDGQSPGAKTDWWLDFITERLNREAPVPTDTKEREYLLYRVVRDLYGTAPSTTEGDAFAADTSPDALKNLARLLAKHPYGQRSDGRIRAGSTKFRVLSKASTEAPATKQPQTPATEMPATPASEKPKSGAADGAPANLDALLTSEALLGTWRGTVDDEKLMLSFHRPPAETEVQLDIYFGDATIGSLAKFAIAEDGKSAVVVRHSAGGSMTFGTLVPGEAGTLELQLDGRQQGQSKVTLTRDAEAATTTPRQAEARTLFALWQRTTNADGTIPGTFIGQLATAVRAYVAANPTLDSAMKLQKLLPRFVTSRDWTQEEAIRLLDDVAYYSTAPIASCVAKASEAAPAVGATEGGEAKSGARIEPPKRVHLWNDKYAAVAFQTEKDVYFVLVYEGSISTGLSESFSTTGRWTIIGNIHLVDRSKTQAAGRNVDKRVVAVQHTSDEPTKLYLDGKAYDLSTPPNTTAKGAVQRPGRTFILRDAGEPIQTERTLFLRNQKDLVTIGDYAAHDRFLAEIPKAGGEDEAAEPKEGE